MLGEEEAKREVDDDLVQFRLCAEINLICWCVFLAESILLVRKEAGRRKREMRLATTTTKCC